MPKSNCSIPADRRERVEKLFWAKVSKTSDCWFWTARINRSGYGLFTWTSVLGLPRVIVTSLAHRMAYFLVVGPILKDLQIDHLCHNRDLSCAGGDGCPHRRCVRPDHLEAVTRIENVRRGRGGALNRMKTRCPRGHVYSPENTYMHAGALIRRYCRTCGNAAQKAYQQRKKHKQEA